MSEANQPNFKSWSGKGFEPGVQTWRLRSKHGRDKIFKTPDDLWKAACEYFQSVDDNPWYKAEVIKGGDFAGDMYSVPVKRPYTIGALCTFCNVWSGWFKDFRLHAKDHCKEFLPVIGMIDDVIYNQKFEGASNGFFNPQFIGKDIGLVERSLLGSDPDNPLPAANVVQFYIPDNRRQEPTPIRGQVIEKEVQFILE